MNRPVEIAAYHRGELQTVRVLSPRTEARSTWAAGTLGASMVAGAMGTAAVVASHAGLVLHAPTFFGSWAVVALGVGTIAARRARDKARRFHLGTAMDADAFGPVEIDLVRRTGGVGYELSVAPGFMSGTVDAGRGVLPVEALGGDEFSSHLPVPEQGAARIELGAMTFVVRPVPDQASSERPASGRSLTLRERVVAALAPLTRLAAVGIPVAIVATLFGSAPHALAVTDADMSSSIPANATPWEAEKKLQQQAQIQAQDLHQCFESLPLSCHRPGYVGVGLKLAKNGEVKHHWVSRSTFGKECPVTACMEKVVAGWFFEPLPEAMTVIVPVQVLRTHKPMPATLTADNGGAASRAIPVTLVDPEDAGAIRATLP